MVLRGPYRIRTMHLESHKCVTIYQILLQEVPYDNIHLYINITAGIQDFIWTIFNAVLKEGFK